MNESIIQAWNAKVGHTDLTYILGDVAFCNVEKATNFVRRLNGRKILVEGNHDHKLLMDTKFRDCFEEVHKYLEITFDKTLVVMFHYRIAEWNRGHHGSVHLFGHAHGNSPEQTNRSMDVGMDATTEVVSELSSIVAHLLKREVIKHH
jgi:calcineurin-like phosphoesterase family protein